MFLSRFLWDQLRPSEWELDQQYYTQNLSSDSRWLIWNQGYFSDLIPGIEQAQGNNSVFVGFQFRFKK